MMLTRTTRFSGQNSQSRPALDTITDGKRRCPSSLWLLLLRAVRACSHNWRTGKIVSYPVGRRQSSR